MIGVCYVGGYIQWWVKVRCSNVSGHELWVIQETKKSKVIILICCGVVGLGYIEREIVYASGYMVVNVCVFVFFVYIWWKLENNICQSLTHSYIRSIKMKMKKSIVMWNCISYIDWGKTIKVDDDDSMREILYIHSYVCGRVGKRRGCKIKIEWSEWRYTNHSIQENSIKNMINELFIEGLILLFVLIANHNPHPNSNRWRALRACGKPFWNHLHWRSPISHSLNRTLAIVSRQCFLLYTINSAPS